MIEKLVLKDKSGRTLEPRDYIVYGHALGRCAGLRYGIVKAIYGAGTHWDGGQKIHARIRGVDDDWQQKEFKLLTKDSTLQFGDRILKVTEKQMPPEVLTLLKKHLAEEEP